VCDDSVRALVDIDARYAVISMTDELPEKVTILTDLLSLKAIVRIQNMII
jgi:hypothetical protein